MGLTTSVNFQKNQQTVQYIPQKLLCSWGCLWIAFGLAFLALLCSTCEAKMGLTTSVNFLKISKIVQYIPKKYNKSGLLFDGCCSDFLLFLKFLEGVKGCGGGGVGEDKAPCDPKAHTNHLQPEMTNRTSIGLSAQSDGFWIENRFFFVAQNVFPYAKKHANMNHETSF